MEQDSWQISNELTQHIFCFLDIWEMGPAARTCKLFQANVEAIRTNPKLWPQLVLLSIFKLEGAEFDFQVIGQNLGTIKWNEFGTQYEDYCQKRIGWETTHHEVVERRKGAELAPLGVFERALRRMCWTGLGIGGGGLLLWQQGAFSEEEGWPVKGYLGLSALALFGNMGKLVWDMCGVAKESAWILWTDGKQKFSDTKPKSSPPVFGQAAITMEMRQKLALQPLALGRFFHSYEGMDSQATKGEISPLHYAFWKSGFVEEGPKDRDSYPTWLKQLKASIEVSNFKSLLELCCYLFSGKPDLFKEAKGIDLPKLKVQVRVLQRLIWTEYRIQICRSNKDKNPPLPLPKGSDKTYQHPYYGELEVPKAKSE
ncbi:MAG: hypothetical protein AB7F31_05335 [Parachlamydiales bacterium]